MFQIELPRVTFDFLAIRNHVEKLSSRAALLRQVGLSKSETFEPLGQTI